MDVGPQLQRLPVPDLDAAESDPALVAVIRAEIDARGPDPVRPLHGARALSTPSTATTGPRPPDPDAAATS